MLVTILAVIAALAVGFVLGVVRYDRTALLPAKGYNPPPPAGDPRPEPPPAPPSPPMPEPVAVAIPSVKISEAPLMPVRSVSGQNGHRKRKKGRR
jgi:hypothetical protein